MTVATEAPATTERPRRLWGPADAVTALRLPLAAVFVLVEDTRVRFAILALAALSDGIDGWVARRWGSSRAGPVLDPVVDKVFTVAAVLAVASTRGGVGLQGWEIAGVLLRDLAVLGGYVAASIFRRRITIPARFPGKCVTVLQFLTLAAILLELPHVRWFAWATAAVSVVAVIDLAREGLRRLRA